MIDETIKHLERSTRAQNGALGIMMHHPGKLHHGRMKLWWKRCRQRFRQRQNTDGCVIICDNKLLDGDKDGHQMRADAAMGSDDG